MRVAAYPADDGGCGAYRVTWPAQALLAQGADIDLHPPVADGGLQGMFQDDEHGVEHLVDVVAPDADVVLLQRPLRRWVAQAVPMLQRQGRRVVVEIDDDFGALHPRNISFDHCHPVKSPDRNFQWLAAACAVADHVVVTTPALARRYGAHGRVSIVPNQVPAWYLHNPRTFAEGVIIGWTGSIDTHPTDLQATGGAVPRVCLDTGASFAVVGTGKGVGRALSFPFDHVTGTGWLSLDDYPKAMAAFDIGIVPLDDIAFNRAKSALKLMEFAALGVACVASPTPDNERLAVAGVGVLAARRREWDRELRALVNHPDWRGEVAARSRAAMVHHTIEGNAGRWWDAWTAPLQARRAA